VTDSVQATVMIIGFIMSTYHGRTHSPVPYVFSFRIFGDLEHYTFSETLGHTEFEKQCLQFFQAPCGRHLGFSKWRLFVLKS